MALYKFDFNFNFNLLTYRQITSSSLTSSPSYFLIGADRFGNLKNKNLVSCRTTCIRVLRCISSHSLI